MRAGGERGGDALPDRRRRHHGVPRDRLTTALHAADLADRLPLVSRTPPALATGDDLYVATAGTDAEHAAARVAACHGKARVPEPLRLAHLVARAIVTGESRGRF